MGERQGKGAGHGLPEKHKDKEKGRRDKERGREQDKGMGKKPSDGLQG